MVRFKHYHFRYPKTPFLTQSVQRYHLSRECGPQETPINCVWILTEFAGWPTPVWLPCLALDCLWFLCRHWPFVVNAISNEGYHCFKGLGSCSFVSPHLIVSVARTRPPISTCVSMFEPGDMCLFRRSGGQLVAATVVGPSLDGDDARSIKYTRDGQEVLHTSAPIVRLQVAESPRTPTRAESPPEKPKKPQRVPIKRQLFIDGFLRMAQEDASRDVVMQLTGDAEQLGQKPRSPTIADDAEIIDCGGGPKKYRKRATVVRTHGTPKDNPSGCTHQVEIFTVCRPHR